MPFTDDKGIGIKGWISGSKPKTRVGESEQIVLDKHRIAVLPFSNISPDAKDEYFADGMTEELISTISKISGLVVIARTSVMGYKGGQKKINDVAKELQVGSVLEGSVRKAGDRLRITVQLIDAQTSGHLWAESYDREMKDVFAIQSDISKTIAQTLRVQLLPGEEATFEIKPTANPEAHVNYLKGRVHWNQRNKAGLARAVGFFERAIQLDPSYALAYSALGSSFFIIGQNGFENPLINYEKARTFARKALQLEENLPEAYATLAGISECVDYDWIKAEEGYKRAIELNPSDATAHQWYHLLLANQGRQREAYDEIKRALELDPLSLIMMVNLVTYLSWRKEYDLAEREVKSILDMDPNFLGAQWQLMEIYLLTSRLQDALEQAKLVSRLMKDLPDSEAPLALVYAKMGKVDGAKKLLSELEQKRVKGEYSTSVGLARLCLLVGDVDGCFKWLEKAYEERDGLLPYLKVIDWFDAIRSDPRYLSMLKKIRLQ